MSESDKPQDFQRRVLLCVVGLSPQVVTETLDVLVEDKPDQFIPTELHIITTSRGADLCRKSLLSDKWFERLCVERGIPMPMFNNNCIHVMTDPKTGEELDDSRSKMHNSASGDFIIRSVQSFTADPQSALHASIAGGRKTMGYFLGVAMSLFARPQDRLSHILVDSDFEDRSFYYRTANEEYRYIKVRDGRTLDAATARLELTDLKFPRLRKLVKASFLKKTSSFLDDIDADLEAHNSDIELDFENKILRAEGVQCSLSPSLLAVLIMIHRYQQEHEKPMPYPYKNPDPESDEYAERLHFNRTMGKLYFNAHAEVRGDVADVPERLVSKLEKFGFNQEMLSPYLNKLKGQVQNLPNADVRYQIVTTKDNDGRQHLALPEAWQRLVIKGHL